MCVAARATAGEFRWHVEFHWHSVALREGVCWILHSSSSAGWHSVVFMA